VHPSFVHGSGSAQFFGVLTHTPPEHESSVQEFSSSQFIGAPGEQLPPEHWSPTVQSSPSSHDALFGACTQAPAAHESSVQGLLSSQSIGAPGEQLPFEH
jgi:hypothetical protein